MSQAALFCLIITIAFGSAYSEPFVATCSETLCLDIYNALIKTPYLAWISQRPYSTLLLVCILCVETQCLANAVVAQNMYSALRPTVS